MKRLHHLALPVLIVVSLLLSGAVASPARAEAPDVWEPGAINREPVGGAAGGEPVEEHPAQTPGEAPALRTATSQTFLEPDGSYRTEMSPAPIHFRDAAGAWQPIDNRLVAEGGGWRNASNPVAVRLPQLLGQAPVRVQRGPAWASAQIQGVAPVPAEVSGSLATYRQALPGVDVGYEAVGEGVKETIILAGPQASSSFRFAVAASPGLAPRQTAAGGLELVDGSGAVVFAFAPAFVVDAAGASSDDVGFAVVARSPQLVVELRPDQAWLADPARVWPVVIDPTLEVVGADAGIDCYIRSGSYADTNLCAEGLLKVGNGGATTSRLLFDFHVEERFDEPVIVRTADLTLTAEGQDYGSGAMNVSVHRVSSSGHFSPNATWNKRTSTDSWANPGGDYAAAIDTQLLGAPGSGSERATWNVTRAVQGFLDGSEAPHGFLLRAANEAPTNRLRVHSKHTGTSADWPRLTIRWEPLQGLREMWGYESFTLSDRRQADVNVASGNLVLTEADVQIPGTGLPLEVARVHNSRSPRTGEAGSRWNLSTHMYLDEEPTGDIALISGDGVWVYDASGSGFRSPSGANNTLARNTDGTFTLTANSSGQRWHFYSTGRLDHTEDRNGNVLDSRYVSGNRTSIVDTQQRVTTFAHQSGATWTVDKVTDPAGRVHDYTYDTSGRLVGYTDPAGRTTGYGYDSSYRLTTVTDPRATVTRIAYDSRNRVTAITFADATAEATTTSFNYTTPWQTVVTDGRGNITTPHFDRQGRVERVVDAAGRTRSTAYNSNSNVTTYTSASVAAAGGTPVTSTYSTEGRNNLTASRLPTGAQSNYTYPTTATGNSRDYNPTCGDSPDGHRAHYGYDTLGNLSSVRSGDPGACSAGGTAGGDLTSATRNPDGTVSRVTDPRGNATTYTYTYRTLTDGSRGELTATAVDHPAPLGDESASYDGVGRPTSTTDGNGQTTRISFDVFDRPTRITYHDGTVLTYTYDANGNRTVRSDPVGAGTGTGTTTSTYDRLNRVTREDLPTGQTNTYAYDAASNLTRHVDRAGTVSYEYDNLNLLAELTEPPRPGDATVWRTTFGYDSDNQRSRTTYPNGVEQTASYDSSGRLKEIKGMRGTTVLTRFTYTYRSASGGDSSLRDSVTDKNNMRTDYDYDRRDRLISAVNPADSYTYTYDPAGNRTSQTLDGAATNYTYNAANQLTAAGSTTYTYDANGNQRTNTAGQDLRYNNRNQTTSMRATSGATTLGLSYSGGSQVDRVTSNDDAFQTNLLGVGLRSYPSGTSTVTDAYTRDNNGALVGLRNNIGLSSESRAYYLFDGLGSVAALTDRFGVLVNTYTYDPYGLTTETRLTNARNNPWRYTSAYQDPTGNYKMGHRYYSPKLGLWTQRDPSGQEANAYQYAGGNPINFTDPQGLAPQPETLSAAEEEAIERRSNGQPYNVPNYNSGMEKRRRNEKYARERNVQKRTSNFVDDLLDTLLPPVIIIS